jgi:hypothetical protein
MAAKKLSEQATKALKLFEDGCVQHHDAFCEKVRDRQNAYRGVLEIASDAAQWTSKLAPPFVGHIVESTLAGLVDDRFAFRVKPKPRFWDPGEFERVREGARAHEILHTCQLKEDHFSEKQWPFALQDAIVGLTVAKTFYRRDRMRRPQLEVQNAAEGLGVFIPRLVEVEGEVTAFEGPTTEVVNVEDFFWHEAAIELQKSPIVAHRIWMHFNELKRLEDEGVYQNVDQLKDTRDMSHDYVEQRVDGTNRTKDMVEVLEIWWREPDGIRTVTLGNRCVELKVAKRNPFWHGEYPFVACSTRPDLFAIPGMSQVQKIAHLQEAHWDLENQTRDNVRLINNAIVVFNRDMVPDPDAHEFAPLERWEVEGDVNNAIKMWSPDPISSQVALPHLSRLEQQMQNLAGGQPFTTTSESSTMGSDTATEAALVTNLAQRATVRLKQQLYHAYERIGQQRTELNKQFIRTEQIASKTGIDSEEEWVEIAPYLLQGDYLFDVSPMNESLMRSERKAESNTFITTAMGILGPWAQLANAGAATPPNFDEFVKEWIETQTDGPADRFFSSKAPQVAPGQPGSPPSPEPEGPGGITAQQSIDPSVSPSSQTSLSGETAFARALSSRGAGTNS